MIFIKYNSTRQDNERNSCTKMSFEGYFSSYDKFKTRSSSKSQWIDRRVDTKHENTWVNIPKINIYLNN